MSSPFDADGFRPGLLSPLPLAFMGDTIYDLLVREALLREGGRPPKQLQPLAAEQVNARAQAVAALRAEPLLTPEEAAVFRRGRNAKPRHRPAGCTREEYSLATALEALFGWLYLSGRMERARELFEITQGL
ncbi:MAG: ribonuclease III [Oscillospiraceae bacterium]|nr:ribonuclease III [Oscillospiraceae bacterium]